MFHASELARCLARKQLEHSSMNGNDEQCLRIQIAAAPVKEAAVSTKHPVILAVLFLAGEQ